jgi:hypothetical protein
MSGYPHVGLREIHRLISIAAPRRGLLRKWSAWKISANPSPSAEERSWIFVHAQEAMNIRITQPNRKDC